jgi:hypothetical protein
MMSNVADTRPPEPAPRPAPRALGAIGVLLALALAACGAPAAPVPAKPAAPASQPQAAPAPAQPAPAEAPAAPAAPAASVPAWQQRWDDVLAKARQEGKVVFAAPAEVVNEYRAGLRRFTELYGIEVEVRGPSGSEVSRSRLTPRAAWRPSSRC